MKVRALLLDMLPVAVLHHVLHGVLPPVADPAEELQTLGQPPRLHPGPVAREVVQHHCQVREQNVETAELAVDPSIEQHKVRNSREIFVSLLT